MGSAPVVLLDTHAWVWWVSDPKRLSTRAANAVEHAVAQGALFVSCISVWEVSLLVARRRIRLSINLKEWIAACEQLPFLTFRPVDNGIALAANSLPGTLHPDPADRMIVATARVLGATLVTKDERLLGYPHVSALW